MKDIFGMEVYVGDTVATSALTAGCTDKGRRALSLGEVLRFTPKGCVVGVAFQYREDSPVLMQEINSQPYQTALQPRQLSS